MTVAVTLGSFPNLKTSVFHLAPVAFKTNRAGGRDFHGGFENFAVAGAVGFGAFYGDDHFVPILGLITLELLVRSGDQIIATLKLGTANEDAAVGVRRGSEFEL